MKTRFVESYSGQVKPVKLEKVPQKLTESISKAKGTFSLQEGIEGVEVWKFPISRINTIDKPNLNGRVYGRELWNNVCDNQTSAWQGLCGLCDHPEGQNPGSFGSQGICWLGMEVPEDEDIVYGYGSFLDNEVGRTAKSIVNVGGRIGFSTSGFGELMPDGITVNPETYEIERLADLVLNPSQGVYGTKDNIYNPTNKVAGTKEFSKQEIIKESATVQSQILKDKENKEKETKMTVDAVKSNVEDTSTEKMTESVEKKPVNRLTKVEEKAWRQYVEGFVNNASKIENPQERLNEMEEIISLFEEGNAPDLKEKVMAKLEEEKKNLTALINESLSVQKEMGVDVNTLKEGSKRLMTEGTKLKIKVEKLEKLNEGFVARNKELLDENTKLKARTALLEAASVTNEEKANVMLVEEKAISTELKEKLEETTSKLEESEAIVEDLSSTNAKLEEKVAKLQKAISIKNETREETMKALKEAQEKFSEKSQESTSLAESHKELRTKYGTALKENTINKKKLQEAEAKINALKAELAEAKKFEKLYKEEHSKNQQYVAASMKQIKENTQATRDFEKKFDEEHSSFKERSKGIFNLREEEGIEIEAYWQNLKEQYGESILPFERKIHGAKTLREAQTAFLNNMGDIISSLNEAIDVPVADFEEERKFFNM